MLMIYGPGPRGSMPRSAMQVRSIARLHILLARRSIQRAGRRRDRDGHKLALRAARPGSVEPHRSGGAFLKARAGPAQCDGALAAPDSPVDKNGRTRQLRLARA